MLAVIAYQLSFSLHRFEGFRATCTPGERRWVMAQVIPVHLAIAGHLGMLEISRAMEVTPSWLPIALAREPVNTKPLKDERG